MRAKPQWRDAPSEGGEGPVPLLAPPPQRGRRVGSDGRGSVEPRCVIVVLWRISCVLEMIEQHATRVQDHAGTSTRSDSGRVGGSGWRQSLSKGSSLPPADSPRLRSARTQSLDAAPKTAPPNLMDLLFDELPAEGGAAEAEVAAATEAMETPWGRMTGPCETGPCETGPSATRLPAEQPTEEGAETVPGDPPALAPSLPSKELGSKSSAISWEDFQAARDPASQAASRRVLVGEAVSQSFNLLGLAGDGEGGAGGQAWNPFEAPAMQEESTNPFLQATNPFEVVDGGEHAAGGPRAVDAVPRSLKDWNPFVD